MSAARLRSWGNHPPFPQKFSSCFWRNELPALLERVRSERSTTLPFGAGRSYGDSCLAASDHVLHMRPLDRFISADWQSGIIVAEAGVSLEQILGVAIPRGWFLTVTPGTKFATLGGAIANDVHGKNHHRRGTFGLHVRRFGLVRSDRGRVTCSPQEEPELYAATIGGLGLTGLIEWAEIQLLPISSSELIETVQRFESLDEFFQLSAELDPQREYCVSWIDCMAKGSRAGRGIYSAADFAADGPLKVQSRRNFSVPLTPPASLINPLSLPALNWWVWHRGPARRTTARVGHESFFYPLDAILQWNRLYGPRGFQQYQTVIPEKEGLFAIRELLDQIARSASASFLAVLKRCGDIPSPGLLSFPKAGISLALDFPQTATLESDLFSRLDAVVREAGGRLYPAKDAHMLGEDFRRAYPAWQQVEALRDPSIMSRFWRRVIQ